MPAAQFAVFGHPIGHSLSPRIHEMFARQCGVELAYRTIDAPPAGFAAAARQFFADGGRGANVTLPHKGAAFALADACSETATRAGSANVLTAQADGRLVAHNTDGAGLLRDLAERHGVDLHDRTVLLLGAGGAAHGVAGCLLDAGVRTLTIVNRSPAPARQLADAIGAQARAWNQLVDIESPDLIVNATSAGVLGAPLALPDSLIGANTLCYDLAYGAAARPFLDWASAGHALALDGLGMLVETAADAFALWHGVRPVTEPVYQWLRREAA